MFLLFISSKVESSRQMYRAVMEEVVRFLDKCHHSLDSLQAGVSGGGGQLGRSKSVVQVSKHHDSDSTDCSATSYSPRARSSTNLVESTSCNQQQQPPQQQHFKKRSHNASAAAAVLLDSDGPQPPQSSSSSCSLYTNFRDLTW